MAHTIRNHYHPKELKSRVKPRARRKSRNAVRQRLKAFTGNVTTEGLE
jgi:hypothetical protein